MARPIREGACAHFETPRSHWRPVGGQWGHSRWSGSALFATAGGFRWLTIADGRQFVREIPKRPPAPSVRHRAFARKRA